MQRLPRPLRGLAEQGRQPELALAALARLGLRELSLIVFLCVAAGAGWLFMEIADGVAEGELEAFDTAILLGRRTPPDLQNHLGPPWLDGMVRAAAELGGNLSTVVVIAASAGKLALRRKRAADP